MSSPRTSHRRRAAVSCVECRKRKVRCSRTLPCTRCVRSRKERTCMYTDINGSPMVGPGVVATVASNSNDGNSIPVSASSSVERGEIFSRLNQGQPVQSVPDEEQTTTDGPRLQSHLETSTGTWHPTAGRVGAAQSYNGPYCASMSVDHFKEPLHGREITVTNCLARGENERIRYWGRTHWATMTNAAVSALL